jgi:hypothetical protein
MSERKRNQSKRSRQPRRRRGPRRQQRVPGQLTSTTQTSGYSIPLRPLFGYTARKTLQYYTVGTVTSGASTAGTYVFAANGLFDTDITGSGGQPMGFDQMMLLFNHYTVLTTTIKVTFYSDTASLRPTVALSVSGSSTGLTDYAQLIENGDVTLQTLMYPGAFGSVCTMRRSVPIGRFQGVRDPMDDPDLRGDSASNPAELTYFHLSVWNQGSVALVTAAFNTIIEYDVLFQEPRKLTRS